MVRAKRCRANVARSAALSAGLGACVWALAPIAAAQPATNDQPECTRQPGQGVAGPPLKKPVKLVPDAAAQAVNFGGSRGTKSTDVVLSATPALPPSVTADQLRLDILHRFTRASQTLPTESAAPPSFSQPKISPGRDRVSFTVCLNGAGLEPGSYAGALIVEGPKGVAPTTISVTENAKNATLARWLAVGVLVAAFLFLLLRGAAARQMKHEEDMLAEAANKGDAAEVRQVHNNPRQHNVAWYFIGVMQDLNWWMTTLVALGVAAGSIIAIYSANAAWGADTLTSVAALVSPVFTAVGVQSVVTSLGRTVGR
jgi:hypothetical protein